MMELKTAIKEVVSGAKAKFDETVEMHINFNLDIKQADQQIRTTTTLPHGTGKTVKVAVMASKEIKDADINLKDEDIVKLQKGKIAPGKDFDVLIVEPAYMAKIARLGPILGPAGVMPNPKAGTVTDDAIKAVEQFKKGKVELRTEPNAALIHMGIGKISFGEKKLEENFSEIYSALKSSKPQKAKPNWIESIFITSTMGKGYEIDINTL